MGKKVDLPEPYRHGTQSAYVNKYCRCDACRAAASKARAVWVESLQDTPFKEVPHGTSSGYKNYGCRCGKCMTWNATRAARQRRNKQVAQQPKVE